MPRKYATKEMAKRNIIKKWHERRLSEIKQNTTKESIGDKKDSYKKKIQMHN